MRLCGSSICRKRVLHAADHQRAWTPAWLFWKVWKRAPDGSHSLQFSDVRNNFPGTVMRLLQELDDRTPHTRSSSGRVYTQTMFLSLWNRFFYLKQHVVTARPQEKKTSRQEEQWKHSWDRERESEEERPSHPHRHHPDDWVSTAHSWNISRKAGKHTTPCNINEDAASQLLGHKLL